MSNCEKCGGAIEFRHIDGNVIPLHLSGGCTGYVNPNAKCPVCGVRVYFYRSPHDGRVFFDALEPPWPKHGPRFDRVYVPEISVRDMFDDAFTAIARDGAGVVEVAVRLQKALHSLASIGDSKMRDAAEYHSRLALKRARNALDISEDLAAVQDAAMFSTTSRSSYNQATSSLARD